MAGEDDAYQRGKTDARLLGHDEHFERINGSLGDVARELHGLKLAVQRLGDEAKSRDATVVTTAAALKDAEEARRDKGEQSWSPIAKAIAVLGAVLGLLGFLYLVVPHR